MVSMEPPCRIADNLEKPLPAFSRAPVADALGTELAGRLNAYMELVLTPHRHRTDGMYVGKQERLTISLAAGTAAMIAEAVIVVSAGA
jgi:hypothetical protein